MDETPIRSGGASDNVQDPTGDAPFFALGIDVGSDALTLALLSPPETGLEPAPHTKSVRNDEAGFKALLRWLDRLTRKAGGAPANDGSPTGGSPVRVCL
ncbi:MAG: hypothetical protein AAF970_15170, partial [Bacteroidota bacterium]